MDFANFLLFDFEFTLHSPPLLGSLNTADQEKLLLPFEQMRGVACRQEVTFAGAFDLALVQRVTQAMTQRVAWLRAGAAEIHDIALSIKRIGDWAFNMGNADMALAKWDDTHNFIKTALHHNDMVRPPVYPTELARASDCSIIICGSCLIAHFMPCSTIVHTTLEHPLTLYRWASV
jgi:hypothetical protein